MKYSSWHPSRARGNISTASTILGVVGLAFNPLFGLAGMLLGSIGQDRKYNEKPKKSKTNIILHTFGKDEPLPIIFKGVIFYGSTTSCLSPE